MINDASLDDDEDAFVIRRPKRRRIHEVCGPCKRFVGNLHIACVKSQDEVDEESSANAVVDAVRKLQLV